MTTLTPYLFFSGNCREAMKFYQKQFGGDLEIKTFADHDESCGDALKSNVMHACLMKNKFVLMASDSPQGEVKFGTNIQIAVNFDSLEAIDNVFNGLSEGGEVISELHDAFWGDRFGVLRDRFGVQWMFTCPLR